MMNPNLKPQYFHHLAVAAILLAAVFGVVPLQHVVGAEQPGKASVRVDAGAAVAYVLKCRKPNGAFGPADQEYTDAAWNYPAVRTLQLLQHKLAQPEAVLKNGLGYPHGHVGYGHWQFFHFHGIRRLLDAPVETQHRQVQLRHQGFKVRYYGSPFGTDGDTFFKAGSGAAPDPRDVAADELGYYNLSSLYYLLAGLQASGREAANADELVAFIRKRQAPGGGFVDVRVKDDRPIDDEAHLAHTFHAVAALAILGAEIPDVAKCAAFIRSCQLEAGAFRWNPRSDLPGNQPDVYYTWAGLQALQLLGQRTKRSAECGRWLNSLQNSDGGFGDQPGWRSRLYSTYYAVEALGTLEKDPRTAITVKQVARPTRSPIPTGRFGIYQGLNKMPVCKPDELASLRQRGFHLLALKSSKFEDAATLLQSIQDRRLPMDAILCLEAYSHRLRWHGGVQFHHVGNFTLDARWNLQQRTRWQTADAAGRDGLAWRDYSRQVIRPVIEFGGLCYPEQDFEMEFAYITYGSAVAAQKQSSPKNETNNEAATSVGYNAVLAGFNWSPRDFVRVFPWRERYVDKLTPIADADAHGDLRKWSPQLDHCRHLFIARGPTFADFQEAARAGRVVCVIHNPEGVASSVTYYGLTSAVAYVRERVGEWRWWGDDGK